MYAEYLIGTFCGKDKPPQIYSTGRYITMMFVTDSHTNSGGFQVKYEQRNAYESCGGYIGASGHGIIQVRNLYSTKIVI